MGRPLPSDLAMAESETTEVVLGMPGPWAEENFESSDHYTTKIGGIPDWPMPAEEVDSELLKCSLCGSDLALVAQVYAPLSVRGARIDERTIYIFGCPSSSCGISPMSWRTLRVQSNTASNEFQNNIRAVGSNTEASSSSTGEDLSEGDHRHLEHERHGTDWWDEDIWATGIGREDLNSEAFMAMEELEAALLEAGYAAATPSILQNTDGEEEITAAFDGSNDEPDDSDLPVLPCFYVYSQNESHPSRGSRAVSALEQAAGRVDISSGGEEEWEGEEYEHDRALSADHTYLKFKKRLDCYPEQCFRYRFKGPPLLASKDTVEPGVCSQCGGPRIYEMQLMPPLLYYLQQACKDLPWTACSANHWEWLTLIVFTCAQSCAPCLSEEGQNRQSNRPWIIVEEATVLQFET